MAVNKYCEGNAIITGAMATKNPQGSRHSAFLQKQMSFKSLVGLNQSSKADELEVGESGQSNARCSSYKKNTALSWVCCAPCSWLQSSSAVHKIAITTATLLVTSLLVASPILFLISTAPSQLPRNCYTDDETCMSIVALPSDCEDHVCKIAASNIHSNLNWNSDPCVEFKTFSCGNNAKYQGLSAIRNIRSAQQSVDIQMQYLLQRNTTFGPFRKLGRLFSSCLRQSTNSSTVRLVLDHLGGYLPIGAVGPSSISQLISKIYELGPTPIVDIYYDLSYGKRPHLLLIISGPNTLAPILESKIRLMGPKAPPYRVKHRLPTLLKDLLECFLPDDLTVEQKISEKEAISTFINELNKKRLEYSRRGFWDSTVLYNISAMRERYPLLNWTSLLPSNWSGPIVVRSSEYLKAMEELLTKYPMRVVHNAMLVLFALGILPQGRSDPLVCTRATMWALPYVSSALFMAQHSLDDVKSATVRTEAMFKSLKAHLKRAPSLKGAALVKLSALKIQSEVWDGFSNMTSILNALDSMDISSDNWMENVLTIYKSNRFVPDDISINSQDTWAFPTIAKVFYDTLSHSIGSTFNVVEHLCISSTREAVNMIFYVSIC